MNWAINKASIVILGYATKSAVQAFLLGMAKASAGEVRAQLYVALDQKYIADEQFKKSYALAESCARQIAKFIAYLEANPRKRRISDDEADYDA